MRLLSGQSSSLEPCVPEEIDVTDNEPPPSSPATRTEAAVWQTNLLQTLASVQHPSGSVDIALIGSAKAPEVVTIKRPDSLILKCSTAIDSPATNASPARVHREHRDTSDGVVEPVASARPSPQSRQKFLYRSNSSRPYHRPKPKVQLTKEFDQIYFIGSNKEDEFYDSIDVIDERRISNFKRSASSATATAATGGLCRSGTVIYSEYCSGAGADVTDVSPTTTTTTAEVLTKDIKSANATSPSMGHINGDNDAAVSGNQPREVKETTTATTRQQQATSQCSMDEIVVMKDDVDQNLVSIATSNSQSAWRHCSNSTTTSTANTMAVTAICAETDSDDDNVGSRSVGSRGVIVEHEWPISPPTTITVRAEIEDRSGMSE